MGIFTYFCGNLACVRCTALTSDCIQTYLVETGPQENQKQYTVGDVVTIDGLSDYVSLFPTQPFCNINIVIGNWGCKVCGLNYQWAILSLRVESGTPSYSAFSAKIVGLESVAPISERRLNEVNFIQEEFYLLASFVTNGPDIALPPEKSPPAVKTDAIASGYRRWLKSVGVQVGNS